MDFWVICENLIFGYFNLKVMIIHGFDDIQIDGMRCRMRFNVRILIELNNGG